MKVLLLHIFYLIFVGYSMAEDENYDGYETSNGWSAGHFNNDFGQYSNRRLDRLNFYSCEALIYRLEKLPMKSIRMFGLNNCGIAEIADDAFENVADSLEELDLSGNILSKMPDLSKLPKLKVLILNNNHIKYISNGVLQQTESDSFGITRLEIASNGILELTKSSFDGFENLKVLDISYNPNIKYSPDAFSSLKLKELSMNGNRLTKLPPGLLESLPSLKKLNVDGNDFIEPPPTELTSSSDDEDYDGYDSSRSSEMGHNWNMDFDKYSNQHVDRLLYYGGDYPIRRLEKLPMKTLKMFGLLHHELEEIDDDAFDNVADSLEYLDLSGNKLKKFPDLSKLTSLKVLKLNGNQIQNIPNAVNSSGITRLEIGDNKFTELTKSSFSQFKNLKVLDISKNTHLRIAPNAFSLLKLKELSMDGMDFTTLPEALKWHPSLKKLSLDENRFSKLPPNAFSTLQNLTSLSLKSNQLPTLPVGVFNGLKNLKKLNLMINGINHLPTGVFSGLDKLEELDLSFNSLTKLQTGLFSEIDSLKKLNLEQNQIEKISRNSLPPLETLTINFRSNKLKTLSIDSFVPLGNSSGLREYHGEDSFNIFLSGNPLMCDKKLAWLAESFIPTPDNENTYSSSAQYEKAQNDPHSDNPLCARPLPKRPLKDMTTYWDKGLFI